VPGGVIEKFGLVTYSRASIRLSLVRDEEFGVSHRVISHCADRFPENVAEEDALLQPIKLHCASNPGSTTRRERERRVHCPGEPKTILDLTNPPHFEYWNGPQSHTNALAAAIVDDFGPLLVKIILGISMPILA